MTLCTPGWQRSLHEAYMSSVLSGKYGNMARAENDQNESSPQRAQVAGAWTERQKMFHGGSFFKLADDNMYIQNPEAQNREVSGF